MEQTLEELRAENERLKSLEKSLGELTAEEEEKRKLQIENKQIAFRLKHGKAVAITQKFVNKTAKLGIKTFGVIQKYGQHLAKVEERNKPPHKLNTSANRKRR